MIPCIKTPKGVRIQRDIRNGENGTGPSTPLHLVIRITLIQTAKIGHANSRSMAGPWNRSWLGTWVPISGRKSSGRFHALVSMDFPRYLCDATPVVSQGVNRMSVYLSGSQRLLVSGGGLVNCRWGKVMKLGTWEWLMVDNFKLFPRALENSAIVVRESGTQWKGFEARCWTKEDFSQHLDHFRTFCFTTYHNRIPSPPHLSHKIFPASSALENHLSLQHRTSSQPFINNNHFKIPFP